MRVKICGITNEKDADKAVEYGADALGFIFYEKSPRVVKPERVREIVQLLPPFVEPVGVFVDAPEEVIRKTMRVSGIHLVQLHGQEQPAFCSRFFPHAIKAFRMQGGGWSDRMGEYQVLGYLLDGFADSEADVLQKRSWLQAKKAAERWKVILAGGLTPKNVGQAIDLVHPYGVDVAGGVEIKPGMKDWVKMRDFIQRAKSVEVAA